MVSRVMKNKSMHSRIKNMVSFPSHRRNWPNFELNFFCVWGLINSNIAARISSEPTELPAQSPLLAYILHVYSCDIKY
jgi:hypothetical protein